MLSGGKPRAWLRENPAAWPLAALLLVLALQLPLVLNRAINWDEFWHYSQVELLAQGTLTQPLMTLYTRAFAWVTRLPGTGVDHIIIIRLFMLACELVTLAAITGIAARFADRATALLCALAYLSAGYVFQHGTSFRFDPPAAALLTGALWVLLRRPLDARAILGTGLLVGAAMMLTIKSVLYAPAFAGVLWLRWSEHGRSPAYAARVVATGAAALAAFAVIYLLHARGLAGDTGGEAGKVVSRSAGKMFSLGWQPYWPHALKGAALAPVLTVLIALVPVLLWRDRRPAAERLALLGLWLPITTLLFYHNTAPYYYAFMLAPVAAACSVALPVLTGRYGAAKVAGAFALGAVMVSAIEPENPIDRQRQIQRAAERIFGGPVAYFDSPAMLGRFPKANAFMTPWGTEQYLAGGYPSLAEQMRRSAVPLVVEDDTMFTAALRTRDAVPHFLPEDLALLRGTYRHFWGPFWIAGVDLPAGAAAVPFEVRVPGPYTLRGTAGAVIDGVALRPGAVIELARGRHLASGDRAAPLQLIWGRNLRAPVEPAPAEPYFMPF